MWITSRKQTLKIGASVLLYSFLLVTSAQALAQTMEFRPDFNDSVNDIAIQGDGRIIVAGSFSKVNEVPRRGLARLNSNGSIDQNFDPHPSSDVFSIAILANGQILIGGAFITIGGSSGFVRNRFALLNSDGTVDASFNPNVNGNVSAIAVQADGKILIGGSFTAVDGIARNKIARLNVDGSLDSSFDPDVNNGTVKTIVLQASGDILIGGGFTSVGGIARERIAQLDAAGAVDLNFSAEVNDDVNSIAIQLDGKILIGGEFTAIGQFVRWRLARLETDGSLDIGYNPTISGVVATIALQNDGKAIAAGNFFNVSDESILRRGIARFNTDGSLNKGFNAKLNNRAAGLALQADGKILVGGNFVEAGNGARGRMARLNADGSLEKLIPDMCLPIISKTASVVVVCL